MTNVARLMQQELIALLMAAKPADGHHSKALVLLGRIARVKHTCHDPPRIESKPTLAHSCCHCHQVLRERQHGVHTSWPARGVAKALTVAEEKHCDICRGLHSTLDVHQRPEGLQQPPPLLTGKRCRSSGCAQTLAIASISVSSSRASGCRPTLRASPVDSPRCSLPLVRRPNRESLVLRCLEGGDMSC